MEKGPFDIILPSPAVGLIKNVVSCLWRKQFKGNGGGEWKKKRKVSLYFTSEQVTNSTLGFVQWSTLAVWVSKAISEHRYTHTPAADKKYPYHNLTGAIMMEVWQIQRALRVQALPRLDGSLINWYCDLVDGGEWDDMTTDLGEI